MLSMDLRRLANFVAVAEAKNISRAALRVNLSQPALSRQIQGLEQELEIALFERAGRSLRLTGAGQDLLERARKVLSEADAFADRVRTLRRGDVGVLRVGATPQTLERVFPAVFARFGADAPGVDVRLREGHPSAISEWLLAGELDLGLIPYRPELRDGCRRAGTIHLVAIGVPGTAARKTLELRELDRAPVLVLNRGFGSRSLFDAACEVAHVQPKIALESSAPATLLSLARAGYGIAVLPTTIAMPKKGVTARRLVQSGRLLASEVAVHWDPRRHLPPFGLRFAEELAKEARVQFERV